MTNANDRLESFGIYKLARQLFDDFWTDSGILGKDYRGRELVRQQIRSLDSICANMEGGYGRGFGKEFPHHLKIARGVRLARAGAAMNEPATFCLPMCWQSVWKHWIRSYVRRSIRAQSA
ncbi:MAG: four helix bundle protein [Anaerolineales bacterium]